MHTSERGTLTRERISRCWRNNELRNLRATSHPHPGDPWCVRACVDTQHPFADHAWDVSVARRYRNFFAPELPAALRGYTMNPV
ncbi:hypothetical protein WN55_11045 [Dufourea novaeangliae]|uniref:Uncharacterized protein n=1 Tax=Dufourea novaeangliae TaxID=178035 RepID=A0A154PBQ5_DUFNO|nr:hypothetical protein WN55_11045 [Dufourea novaeangliae]